MIQIFKCSPRQNDVSRFLLRLYVLVKLGYKMSVLTLNCQEEDQAGGEIIHHLPSYAEAKMMKLLTLHVQLELPFWD